MGPSYIGQLAQWIASHWDRFWFQPAGAYRLAQLRWLIGLLALWWIVSFTPDLVEWFGPEGRLPVDTIRSWRQADPGRGGWGFSWFEWTDRSAWLWMLHGLSIAAVVAFTAGLYTRLATVLALAAILSYVHRAPVLAGTFEYVLCSWLFYLCWAPTGQYGSLDLLRQSPRPAPHPTVSANVVQRLIQVHLSGIYLFMALFKLGGATWWLGEATWWLVAQQDSPLVSWHGLNRYPLLLNAWTHAIVLFELLFAVLIWVPMLRRLLIALAMLHWALLALATGQVGLAVFMAGSGWIFWPEQQRCLLQLAA